MPIDQHWLPKTFEEALDAALRMEGPLEQRLDAYARWMRHLDSGWAAAYDRLIAAQISGHAGASAPAAGDRMPEFLLPSQEGRLISLDTLLEQGPLVVSFNRGHWCHFCLIELKALCDAVPAIRAAGANLVSITPELSRHCVDLRKRLSLPFSVLSDLDTAYGLSIGLMTSLGEEAGQLWLDAGFDIASFQGCRVASVPIPATFVVGRDGMIWARHVDPDFRKRMAVEDMLGALKRGAG